MHPSAHEQLGRERGAHDAHLAGAARQRAFAQLRAELASLGLDLALIELKRALALKYRADQPRVPAGNPHGGQWTDGGDSGISPDLVDDAQWASGRNRAPTRALINGRWQALTPGQGARLAVAEARARDTLQNVRERDPDWRPTPFLAQTVEGQIRGVEGEAREAQARLLELQRAGIGPGRFAAESIPARGPERDFTAGERREINRIGGETGCHTCGTIDPGTRRGNFVPDHQMPTARNALGSPQRLYPQCIRCSDAQGLWIIRQRGGRDR